MLNFADFLVDSIIVVFLLCALVLVVLGAWTLGTWVFTGSPY